MFPGLNLLNARMSAIGVQSFPEEGPKVLTVLCDFTGATKGYIVDYTDAQQKGLMSSVQTLYIDNSQTGADIVTVTMDGTNQQVIVKANTQGFYPVLQGPVIKFTVQTKAGTNILPVYALNVPVAPAQWATA